MSKIKPILFSAPMVRALLDGRKTQTRRVLKPQPDEPPGFRPPIGFSYMTPPRHYEMRGWTADQGPLMRHRPLPYWQGDLLWVRETWRLTHVGGGRGGNVLPFNSYELQWRATDLDVERFTFEGEDDPFIRFAADGWRPSIFMPRWASRLTLEVTNVKVERLLDISEEDAKAEGFAAGPIGDPMPETPIGGGWTISSPGGWASAAGHFQILWQEINREWDGFSSPWVVAVTFKVHRVNVDAFLAQRTEAA